MLPNVLQPNATDHVPVLAHEVRASLAVRPGQTVVDATFGAGGHATLLAADLQGRGRPIALDLDPTAREYFDRFEKSARVPARLLRGDFGVVLEQLAENGVRADAILLDLGVSSMQLDRPDRGFSYSVDAPLDMRMDTTQDLTAREIVNEWPERELATIFRRYGEERYAKQIARAIGRRRKEEPFARTGELVDAIKAAIPAPARFGDGHPAKRVFQALRIAVNDELGSLEAALPAALEMLRPGGRLAVISFHSLEDRIVKQFLRDRERGCTCPPDFPVCICGHEPELRAIERRPIKPSEAEIAANPRAASARLRAAVKSGGDENGADA
jgi:16S rRNA (cytosine1402-N4)-methyltransferase